MKVMLVCSSGGHLTQLYRLKPWWQQHDRTWVTSAGPQTESLLKGERVQLAYSPTTRNVPNAVRNFWLAVQLVRRQRPDLIVSDGAGVAFPFFLVARAYGVRTVYLEVYDRITRPDTDRAPVLPPLRAVPAAMAGADRPVSARQSRRRTPVTGSSTSNAGARRVVVTVGTDHHPFDRLVSWVNSWIELHPERASDFFVQSGAASVAPICRSTPFLEAGQLDAELQQAHLMICHGGPGSIADAWDRGHVPIVVPRLRRLGEVVDDHQVDFCEKLDEIGRVRLARTPAVFANLIDEGISDSRRFRADSSDAEVEATVARFALLVDDLVGRPRRRLLGRRAPATQPQQAKDPSRDAGGSRAQLVHPLLKVTVKQ